MKWLPIKDKNGENLSQFPENGIIRCYAGKKAVCLIKNDKGYFAVKDRCPHAGGRLSDGWCENGRVVCPLHRHSFNLENGRGTAEYGDAVTVYQVRSQNSELEVLMPKFTLWPFG